MIEIDQFHVESLANLREHWSARARRMKAERSIVGWSLKTTERPELPCAVRLTRIGPRKLDDDNAIGGLKATRDAVAEWLRVNDADPRVQWRYGQERAKRYALRIEFEKTDAT